LEQCQTFAYFFTKITILTVGIRQKGSKLSLKNT